MKEWLNLLKTLLKIGQKTYLEIKKRKKQKEITDVREAIKNTDLNALRDIVLGSSYIGDK